RAHPPPPSVPTRRSSDLSLDLAINGNGFFALSAQGQMMYTRAGEFGTDKDGYIQNSSGFRLQGYEVGVGGQILQGKKVDLRVDTSNVSPEATRLINGTINLASTAPIVPGAPADLDRAEERRAGKAWPCT